MAYQAPSVYEPYTHMKEGDDTGKLLPERNRDQEGFVKPQGSRQRRTGTATTCLRIFLRTILLLISVTVLAVQIYSVKIWLITRHESFNVRTGSTYMKTTAWAAIDAGPTWTLIGVAFFAFLIHLLSLISLSSCVRLIAITRAYSTWADYLIVPPYPSRQISPIQRVLEFSPLNYRMDCGTGILQMGR